MKQTAWNTTGHHEFEAHEIEIVQQREGMHILVYIPSLCFCEELPYTVDAVRKRYEVLGIQDVYIGCSRKIDTYQYFLDKYGLQDEEVMYMGDDIPDYEILQRCGLPCCPADAAQVIKQICAYVSPLCGGYGCARDVIEQILAVQGKWMAGIHAFAW